MGGDAAPLKPYVIAIVLNYELPDVTADCVKSLLQSDYPRLDVLIVDNGSRDNSVLRLKKQFPDTMILEVGENLLFAGGMNVGLQHALEQGADYALVLNNDTRIAPDMVSRLVQTAASRPKAGVVAPMITDLEGRVWAMGSRKRKHWPFPRELRRAMRRRRWAEGPIRVDYVTGCGFLVRADVLGRVGLFDPFYRFYYEDADLCARVGEAGYELWVDPMAQMIHLVSLSARRQASQSCYLHARYRLCFYRQHRQPLWMLGHALLLSQEVSKALADCIAGRKDLAVARLRGARDGLYDALPSNSAKGAA